MLGNDNGGKEDKNEEDEVVLSRLSLSLSHLPTYTKLVDTSGLKVELPFILNSRPSRDVLLSDNKLER